MSGIDKKLIIRPLSKNDSREIGELTISFRKEIGCDSLYSLDEFENLFDTPWLKNGIGLALEKDLKLIAYGWVSFITWRRRDVVHLGLFLSKQARERYYYQPFIEELIAHGKNLAENYKTRELFFFTRAVDTIHSTILKEFGFQRHPISMLGMSRDLDSIPRLSCFDKITIRNLKLPSEKTILRELSQAAFDDPSNQGEPLHESMLDLEMKSPGFKPEQVIVAEFDNEPVGYLVMFNCKNFPCPAYEIVDFGVLPQWRRKGIGRLLLISGLNWIKSQNASKAIASTFTSNPAIVIFWQLGFRPDPSRTYNFFIKTI